MNNILRIFKAPIYLLIGISLFSGYGCKTNKEYIDHTLNDIFIFGEFQDDYGLEYSITNSSWILKPDMKYQILKWDQDNDYIITSSVDDSSILKYSRLDYVILKDMAPYTWCYCISAYNKNSAKEAEGSLIANRNDLKKGCNGFPFSRMKVLKR